MELWRQAEAEEARADVDEAAEDVRSTTAGEAVAAVKRWRWLAPEETTEAGVGGTTTRSREVE